MGTFYGTNDDDTIDGNTLPENTNRIDPKSGNDSLTNLQSVEVISGPGNDSIVGVDVRYMLWYAKENLTVNLAEGFALDGFGFRDSLVGVTTVQLPNDLANPIDSTVIGSENDETVFVFSGNNVIDLDDGDDLVIFYNSISSDYIFEKNNNSVIVTNIKINSRTELIGNELIEFRPEQRIIDTAYLDSVISGNFIKVIYSFVDSTTHSGFGNLYGYTAPGPVQWANHASIIFDINNDGVNDFISPMWKGYQTGIDNRTPFIALTSNNGSLEYNSTINSTMPITSAARRAETIIIGPSEELAVVTVNTDLRNGSVRFSTESAIPSELKLLFSDQSLLDQSILLPRLPNSTQEYPYAVQAHALATGDINGDALEDILVGHYSYNPAFNKTSQDGSGYALLQETDGKFSIHIQPIFKKITLTGEWAPEAVLYDLHLADINNDGFDDLIAGWGHGTTSSYIFLNDAGLFSESNIIALPDSIYGESNQTHLKTLSADFDHDGDIDLAIQRSRFDPYYQGNYIQILSNNGKGIFTDVTTNIFGNSLIDAYSESYVEHWQLIDINNDGHIDIAGSRPKTSEPLIYLNDGKGVFEILEIPTDWIGYGASLETVAYGDYNDNGIIELIKFSHKKNLNQLDSTNSFLLFELNKLVGTGPDHATSSSLGVPGFNERYYLNTHTSAKEAVTSGTYFSGLQHYLAEGKKAGLSAFAPFTKITGEVGVDTVTFNGEFASYSVDTSNKIWTVTEDFTLHTYSVENIERIEFSNNAIAYDIEGNAGNTVKLLGLLLGKDQATNKTYVGAGLKLLDDGMTYEQLMGAALDVILGANASSLSVVELIWNNLIGPPTPADNISQYSALIDNGAYTSAGLAIAAANHDLNATNIDLVGLAQTGVEYIPYG